MFEGNYGQYICRGVKDMDIPGDKEKKQGMLLGRDSWPGMDTVNCNFAFIPVTKAGMMPDPPHTHETDEYLYFFSANPLDMRDFDAEIEIAFGDEWEKHVIKEPAVIYFPAGLQHCPLNIKRVGKPFFFGHIMNTPKYGKLGQQS